MPGGSEIGANMLIQGIVHRNRKDRGEANSVVHGLCTDTYTFCFRKIDNDSKVSSPVLELHYYTNSIQVTSSIPYRLDMGHFPKIVTLIENILQHVDEDCMEDIETGRPLAPSM